ncbi:MAG: uroporphyrinogen-III synthase [Bacteroidota bacterium]|nr:uroporphyrinogen-III synthase [Bacteroidota bacterium]
MASPQQKFSLSPSRPLSGKTVLVTRPRQQSSEFVKLLEQLGATVELFPTIQIVPPSSWNDCDRAISNIETYDGIIVTSQNASDFFFWRMKEKGVEVQKTFLQKKVYVIGKKTEENVEKFGIHAKPLPEIADSTHFAAFLTKEAINGKRFLFPKGTLAGDALPATLRNHGAYVDEVVVYKTTAPPSTDTARISRLLREKEIDIVTFFSPSSLTNFLDLIAPNLLNGVVIAAIGNTTADAIRTAGLETEIVAEQSTASGLVAAIVKFSSKKLSG